ncbi:alpha/beta hydrolase-fold protein [Brevundimonas sp. 2R-24]|uniref:Alpha/beta hydrolase-fold protein n=1 Tax=Peiella sedimenti TaxID=3061083 RepID=A0ABT8SL74_9CAUL|nr:alpha/beta hydrolase-fold protein [Caulobacteraceae bacterium XZ-24]
MPFSQIIRLSSAVNGIEYLLYVRTPPSYADNPERRYRIVLTLDADYSFPLCAMHLEHLADRMDQGPDAILVSVAYAGAYPDRDRYRAERTRDYTPIAFPTGGYGPEFQRNSGGGPRFLDVLTDEVLPLIEARFRTAPGQRTLVGHSYGGLFCCWVLQERPHAFDQYLSVSPSLWYADEWLLVREAAGERAALTRPTLFYLGVGSWEEQPERNQRMVSQARRFGELLAARGDSNLQHEVRVFEDETHASIFPAAFSTGIRHLHYAARNSA